MILRSFTLPSQSLLDKAIALAQEFVNIKEEEKRILTHYQKSLLFYKHEIWTKKDKDFDVGIGSYDSTDVSELVGIFLL